MRKFILPSVAVIVAFAGLSAPVLAESLSNSSDSDFSEAIVLQQLRAKGINATSASEWGTEIQATVVANGQQSFVYFEPDTLKQISENGQTGATRVLSRVDSGVVKPFAGQATSLISQQDATTD